MALPPDRELIATQIAARELHVALIELSAVVEAVAVDSFDAAVLDIADQAGAQAIFEDVARLYAQRSARLLSLDPDRVTFLQELEKGIVARLTAFRSTPVGRGSSDILASAALKLRPILLAARGSTLPGRQQ